jgi:hypothetical protein
MTVPLKLNAIDQEHLQELYNAAGVARDELPYTEAYEALWQGFQDRTFKNADREQLFAAIIKYVRSSGNASANVAAPNLSDDQIKQLKAVLSRHLTGGKVLPYGDAFQSARTEFNKAAGTDLNEHDFWHAILKAQGPKRQPPKRKKVAAAKPDEDDDVE